MPQFKTTIELIETAGELAASGATNGEVADELNVSRDTASWLVRKSDVGSATQQPDEPATSPKSTEYRPRDIHVDWSAIGHGSTRLDLLGRAMADLLERTVTDAGLTVGIERGGTSIATVISRELGTDFAAYAPAKHQWEEGDIEGLEGTFSRNFARVAGEDCYLVDDTITSGTTMREAINAVRDEGGTLVACVVLVDKQGIEEIDDIPVYSLIDVARVGE